MNDGIMRDKTPSQKLLAYFGSEHLPDRLKEVSQACRSMAEHMEEALPDGPEKTVGMRKLLEAKDCFVRAAL